MSILATAFYFYAFAKGAALLPSSVAGMLSGAIPLFTFAMTAPFLKEEPVTGRKRLKRIRPASARTAAGAVESINGGEMREEMKQADSSRTGATIRRLWPGG